MTPLHSEMLMRERIRDLDAAARRSRHADAWDRPAAPSWRGRMTALVHRADRTDRARDIRDSKGQALRI